MSFETQCLNHNEQEVLKGLRERKINCFINCCFQGKKLTLKTNHIFYILFINIPNKCMKIWLLQYDIMLINCTLNNCFQQEYVSLYLIREIIWQNVVTITVNIIYMNMNIYTLQKLCKSQSSGSRSHSKCSKLYHTLKIYLPDFNSNEFK